MCCVSKHFNSDLFLCVLIFPVWLCLTRAHVSLSVSPLCPSGILEWPFWTKLVVVAIGFTGGLVFMYVQCKVYIHLWKRLKAYNRVIYVQNRPDTCKKPALEKPPLLEPSLENKEVLAPTQSDTNSSQHTETEEYSMEVLHVWQHVHVVACPAHAHTNGLTVTSSSRGNAARLIADWSSVLLWLYLLLSTVHFSSHRFFPRTGPFVPTSRNARKQTRTLTCTPSDEQD